MASIAMDERRPRRSCLFFYVSASESQELLRLLARASDFPGRVRRMPLVPTPDSAFRPEWSRVELEIVAEEGVAHAVALRDLDRRVLRLVVRPHEDTNFHQALRQVVEGAWDFAMHMPILDEKVRPTKNAVRVTFL